MSSTTASPQAAHRPAGAPPPTVPPPPGSNPFAATVADLAGLVEATIVSVGQIRLVGVTICPEWLRHLTTPKGKPDLTTAYLLGYLWGWYRPRLVRDEKTGQVVRQERRFRGPAFDLTAAQAADLLGCSTDKAKEAISKLVEKGLLRRFDLTVTGPDGTFQPNTPHLVVVPEAVLAISQPAVPVAPAAEPAPAAAEEAGEEGPGKNSPHPPGKNPPHPSPEKNPPHPNTPSLGSPNSVDALRRLRASARSLADTMEDVVRAVREAKNPTATVVEVVEALYGQAALPRRDGKVNFAFAGQTAKNVGGFDRLVALLFQYAAPGRRPAGDVLAYIDAAEGRGKRARKRREDYHAKKAAAQAATVDTGTDYDALA